MPGISIVYTDDVHEKLKKLASVEHRSMRGVLINLIEESYGRLQDSGKVGGDLS